MNIDILSALPNSAAAGTDASLDAGEGVPGTFASLLDSVGDEISDAGAAEDVQQIAPVDWLAVPVIVPFVPPVAEDVEAVGQEEVDPLTSGVETAIDAEAMVSTTRTDLPDMAAVVPEIAGMIGVNAGATLDATLDAPSPAATASAPRPDAGAPTELQTSEATATAHAGPVDTGDNLRQSAQNSPSLAVPNSVAEQPSAPSPSVAAPQRAVAKEPDTPAAAAVITPIPQPSGDAASEASAPALEDPVAVAERAPKGTAARLARALERAADPSAVQRAAAAAADSGQTFDPNAESHESLGEWLRGQLPLATSGRTPANATPLFNITPTPHPSATVSPTTPSRLVSPEFATPALPEGQDVTLQMVQSLRIQFRDGIGEAVIRLKPEHLGSVAISLRIENGGLKASVQAEQPAVRQWLETQQDTLRSALSEHGLRLDRFDVDPERHRQSQPDDPRDERMFRKRPQRRTDPDEQPVFEVVV